MATSKQASRHTHARAQCSHPSVGLTQARPNYTSRLLLCQTNTVEPHFLNTVLCKTSKQAMHHKGELNTTFICHETHDIRRKIKNKTVKYRPGLE